MVDNEGEMVVIKRKYGRKWFRWSRIEEKEVVDIACVGKEVVQMVENEEEEMVVIKRK